MVLALVLAGAGFVATQGSEASPQPETGRTALAEAPLIARAHWAGKKHVAADTNAAMVMGIWSMPESTNLEAQTLTRLTFAMERWLGGVKGTNAPGTNATNLLLRSLAEDLLQEESCFEIRQPGGQAPEIALAIRLSQERSATWSTNLAAAIEVWTGQHATPSGGVGWSVQCAKPAASIAFSRVGDWALVGVGSRDRAQNGTFSRFVSSIQQQHRPLAALGSNVWLDATHDFARCDAVRGASWLPTTNLPRIDLQWTCDNQGVRTVARAMFPHALGFQPEPWTIPTNLVHDPLTSFTAMQGLRGWLADFPLWKQLIPEFAPNQLLLWAQGRLPLQSFLAVPDPAASNHLAEIVDHGFPAANSWIGSNSIGVLQFQSQSNPPSLLWAGVPFADPRLEITHDGPGEFIVGTVGAPAYTNRPFPISLWQQVAGNPKLVAYSWELTGQRIEAGLYVTQLARLLLRLPQVPPQSVGITWLRSLEDRLGNCGTSITRTGPAELALVRRSSLGLSAFELNLFVDWLESPLFPHYLHTFDAPRPPPIKRRGKGNRPPPASGK